MSPTRTSALALGFVSVLLLCAQTGGQQRDTKAGKPIVIVAEVVNGKVVYQVDSKPALPDILRVLNIVEEERGKDYPVVALIDSRAKISEFGNIDGIAGKAQLTNIRFFVFNREMGKMSEVRWLPSVPFSTDPPENEDPPGLR